PDYQVLERLAQRPPRIDRSRLDVLPQLLQSGPPQLADSGFVLRIRRHARPPCQAFRRLPRLSHPLASEAQPEVPLRTGELAHDLPIISRGCLANQVIDGLSYPAKCLALAEASSPPPIRLLPGVVKVPEGRRCCSAPPLRRPGRAEAAAGSAGHA